jgi:branched-chain amino acid transport system substrate-binding protein
MTRIASSGRRASIIAIAAVALATGACAHAGSASNASQPGIIKIGVSLPITGVDASDGVPAAEAVKLAVEDANAHDLVPGFTLQVEVLDDAVNGLHNAKRGGENFQRLNGDSAVLGVIGPLNSDVALTEIPLSNEDGLALISPANTSPELTKGTRALELRRAHPDQVTYFRVCTTDDIQGPAGATYEYDQLKARTAYVVDDSNTFGRGISDEWARQFQSEGGRILAHEHSTGQSADFASVAVRVKAAHPDIVFFGGEAGTGGAKFKIALDAAGLGNIPYASGDGIQNDEYLKLTGKDAANSYATVAAVNADALPSAGEFVRTYRSRETAPLGAYAANSYAAAQALIAAIGQASADDKSALPSRAEVLAKLRATQNVPTVIGSFSFDENGDTSEHIISIYKARAGKWAFLYQRDFASGP